MDPLRSYLGRLLLEDITPVVMVLTTPLAEAACRTSGLSFVDMLFPFSLFKKIDVPVRLDFSGVARFGSALNFSTSLRLQICKNVGTGERKRPKEKRPNKVAAPGSKDLSSQRQQQRK